jgi:hypothetical protein
MLSDAEVAAKGSAMAKYASQLEVMPAFLAAFVRRSEPFVLLSAGDVGETERMISQSANSEYRSDRPRDYRTPNR